MKNAFQKKVYDYVRTVPRGKVVTYKHIAEAIGRPGAARAVGSALKRNPQPFYKVKQGSIKAQRQDLVPCHRVVRADRLVGGYAGGGRAKAMLLRREGVRIEKGRIDSDHIK